MRGTQVGYARVSTRDQDPRPQHDALEAAGVARIFTEIASGATQQRPQLAACLDYLEADDTLVVWRLDRLGRSLRDLVGIVDDLRRRGVQFRSLTEGFDTTSPGGSLVFHVFAAVAEFERNLIRERTHAGLEAARRQGRTGGRPSVMTPDRLRLAQTLRSNGGTLRDIAEVLGVSKSTLSRHLAADQ